MISSLLARTPPSLYILVGNYDREREDIEVRMLKGGREERDEDDVGWEGGRMGVREGKKVEKEVGKVGGSEGGGRKVIK